MDSCVGEFKTCLGEWSKRLRWGILYLIWGVVFLMYFAFSKCLILSLVHKHTDILWVAGWASLGIGAGLINSRENDSYKNRQDSHYIFYFGFAFFVSSLAAYALGRPEGSTVID